MSDNQEFDIDEYEDEKASDSNDEKSSFQLVEYWKMLDRKARIKHIALGIAGFIFLLFLIGAISGGDDSPEVKEGPSTLDQADPLRNLPALAPIVLSQLQEGERGAFANHVRAVTADGTSVCDVFYGVVKETTASGKERWIWTITTPNMQAREGENGVKLPSSRWPVKAFYGPPCDVMDQDVHLTIPNPSMGTAGNTTSMPTTSTTEPAEETTTTEPITPVTAG